MSIEPRPGRKPSRTVGSWRQAVGLAASVAVHAGLAVALMLAASSDHGAGMRDSVPISVLTRGRTGVTAPTMLPGAQVVARDQPVTHPASRRRPAGAQYTHVTTRASNADMTQRIADTSVPIDGNVGLDIHERNAEGDGSGSHDDAVAVQGSGSPVEPALTGGGADGSGKTPGTGLPASPGTTDEDAAVRLEADRVYALQVRKALERQGAYPSTARRLGLEGLVEMLVRIDGSGVLFERRVLSTSGFPQLDDAALASADRLGALPPPPGGRPIDIRIPVRFSVRRN